MSIKPITLTVHPDDVARFALRCGAYFGVLLALAIVSGLARYFLHASVETTSMAVGWFACSFWRAIFK